jgi:hypothetical protein
MKKRETLGISLMFSGNMNWIKLWSVILITIQKSQRFLFAPKRMKINVFFRVLLDGHFEHPLFIHFNSFLYKFFPYDLYAYLLSTTWHLGPNIQKNLKF